MNEILAKTSIADLAERTAVVGPAPVQASPQPAPVKLLI